MVALVEMRGREERREVDWRGNAQLFQALEKGPWIWGAGGRFSQIPRRDGVAGAGGPFARVVGGTFRAIAFGFGGRIGAR